MRAKFEIATGEEFSPIKQDTKNGKLKFYQHGMLDCCIKCATIAYIIC